MGVLVRERETAAPRSLLVRVPAWAKLSLIVFVVVEVLLLLVLRLASGLADVQAIQELSAAELSVQTASAACTEGLAAVDDLWPAVPLLNLGRVLPFATARALGQVPPLVDVARQACPAMQTYASVAPTSDRSLDDGVAADLLTNVRRDQAQLVQADAQLSAAWAQLDNLDVAALSADPHFARVARLVDVARTQKSDMSDGLALLAPQRLESLLGGSTPGAIVLSAPGGQAYMVFDQGRLVRIGLDQPEVAPVAIISVDQTGLDNLRTALPHGNTPSDAPDSLVAESLLAQLVRHSLNDDTNVASVLKHSADDHHAWLWFSDPALQEMVARRGWIRQ